MDIRHIRTSGHVPRSLFDGHKPTAYLSRALYFSHQSLLLRFRALAGGCLALQSDLAESALESIEADTHAYAPSLQAPPTIVLPPW